MLAIRRCCMKSVGRLLCWVISTTNPCWMIKAGFKQHYMDRCLVSSSVQRVLNLLWIHNDKWAAHCGQHGSFACVT